MKKVLVTGATGFVGTVLSRSLAAAGYSVRVALRQQREPPAGATDSVVVGDISSTTDWADALSDVDCVVHLAARVHMLNISHDAPDLYSETNVLGTQRLVSASVGAGVRRFVFLSSVKVNGEETRARAFAAADAPQPQDAYGRSKWAAEQVIGAAAAGGVMEAVIVRPPLVYGPGVRANFLRLMRWVDAGWVLPLGAVRNQRSLVSVWTLADLLTNVISNRAAAGGTWMISDGEDLSTPELIRRIAGAMGRRASLVPVPVAVLRAAAAMIGRSAEVSRLCGSLVVDAAPTRAALGWKPELSVDEALHRTVEWFKSERHSRAP